MKAIRNVWARLFISLFYGGLMNELVFVLSGDPSRHRSKDDPNFSLLYAAIAFAILSWLNKKYNKDEGKKKDEFEQWKKGAASDETK